MDTPTVSNSSAILNSLANNADGDVARTAKLMKKVMQADKDMVSKLLPLPQTGLDIQA